MFCGVVVFGDEIADILEFLFLNTIAHYEFINLTYES